MRRLFISATIMFFAGLTHSIQAQSEYTYCELYQWTATISDRAFVDFGSQEDDYMSLQERRDYKKRLRKEFSFDSMVEGLNYMTEQGWELVVTDYIHYADSGKRAWLLRRLKNYDEE